MPTLDWIGKKAVENHHHEVPYRLLRCVPELSVGEPGGGFRYCELGETLFEADGSIRSEVRFPELAAHVFFTEMREPLPAPVDGTTPLIGVVRGTAVYLLYNGVLKDKRPNGGNVLTQETLRGLPSHDGSKIVYGTACTLGAATLKRHGVTFRQIPYEVRSN